MQRLFSTSTRILTIVLFCICISVNASAQKVYKVISFDGKVEIKKQGNKGFENIAGYTFIQAEDVIKIADKAVVYLVRDDQKVYKVAVPGQYNIAKLNKSIKQFEVPQYSKSVGKYYWERLMHGHKDLKDYPQKSLYVKGGVYRGNDCSLPYDSITVLSEGLKLGCAGNYRLSFYDLDNKDFPILTLNATDSLQILPALSSVFKAGQNYLFTVTKDGNSGSEQNFKTFNIANKSQLNAIDAEINKLLEDKEMTSDFRMVLMAEVYERNKVYNKAELYYKQAITEAKEYGCFAKEMYALFLQRMGNEDGANHVMQSRTCGM